MLRSACSTVFVCTLATAAPVLAQVEAPAVLPTTPLLALWHLAPEAPGAQHLALLHLAPAPSTQHLALLHVAPTPIQHRPSALIPLYASFATLQALDYASTTRALESGRGTEANPVMRSIVKSPPAFIAVKAAATAGVIVAGEMMWKKNRVAAVIFVAAANGAVAAIVARNYSAR
jgi:Domain of unknown function (DUF5658)